MEENQILSQLKLWGNRFDQPSAKCFHELFEGGHELNWDEFNWTQYAGRFKYLQMAFDCDFKIYVVDGEYHIAQD